MYVRDLEGNEYPIQVTSTNDYDLNGNQALSCAIESNKVNDLFIDNIIEMWSIVDHDEVVHKIIYAKKKGKGNRLTVNIKAIPLFFDKLNSDRVYETYDEHMTAQKYFSIVFKDTGFNFILLDSFEAVQWQGVGKGSAKLKLFKDGIDRYKCEFRIVGNVVYLESQIGRDTNFQYRHKLNASDITQEIDAAGFWTHAKGFGDYESGNESNPGLIREYTSPLAQIPGIGIRHAPPIYDGRVTDKNTMDKSLKALVDESLKISVSATIHDLRKQGYALAQPELGDRTFLIDERIGLDAEVRINNISLTRDWEGNILDLKLIFGSMALAKRHQSDLKAAIDRLTALYEGREQLPFNALDAAVQIATKALQSAQTELIFDNGIIARDKNNPNMVVLLNSAGIGISNDGGKTFRTAMTGSGIVADVIIAGIIKGLILEGSEIKGGKITGTTFEAGTITGGKINGGTITGTEVNGSEINGGIITGVEINGSEFNTTGSASETIKIVDGTLESKSGNDQTILNSGKLEIKTKYANGYGRLVISPQGVQFFVGQTEGNTTRSLGNFTFATGGSYSGWKTNLTVGELHADTIYTNGQSLESGTTSLQTFSTDSEVIELNKTIEELSARIEKLESAK